MESLKVGIIGVGNIAQCHIKAYQNNPQAELYAFCDNNEDRLKAMGEKYGITHLYTDYHDMVRDDNISIVSICTSNYMHAPCAIAALNAGKHVLCEKPMAVDLASAQQMKQAAEENKRLLMVGFVRRFGNDFRVLKEMIDEDFFGEFYYAKATYLRRNGNPGGWFYDRTKSGGGPLIDLGVHVIDYVRYAMGNPKAVSVYGATIQKLFNRSHLKTAKEYTASDCDQESVCNVEDLASAMIRFDNGAVLSVETGFSLHTKEDSGNIELFGTKAGAKVSPSLELYSETNGYMSDINLRVDTEFDFGVMFQNEINHFVDCALKKSDCISPAEDGVELMRIIDAVYRSAQSGHEVVLV